MRSAETIARQIEALALDVRELVRPDFPLPDYALPDARAVIRLRRLRDQYFPGGWFADPAWDMLLDLYAARSEGRMITVSSLCTAAAVPPSTALRWQTRMIEGQLITRTPLKTDLRKSVIELSPGTIDAMDDYVVAAMRLLRRTAARARR